MSGCELLLGAVSLNGLIVENGLVTATDAFGACDWTA